jgi:hypothetical protein
MDIAFDRKSWTRDPADRAVGKSTSPEWHGLRARLVAARATRRVLSEDSAAGGAAFAGSFDGASARVLADYGERLSAVNPVFWAYGKPVQGMDANIAGETNPGDRG